MKVLKFGGTSVGGYGQIRKVVKLISDDNRKIVVFSAIAGVTNLISEFIQQLRKKNQVTSKQILKLIEETHLNIIDKLLTSKDFKQIANRKVKSSMDIFYKLLGKKVTLLDEKRLFAQGELLSSMIIYIYMLEQEIDVALLPALKYMKTNKFKEPDYKYIKTKLNRELDKHKGCRLFITNGFVCNNNRNKIDNLGRGGSDFTATIIGKAIEVNEIEIWSDVDGLHNNDPRYVEKTESISNLSYDEAGELAYFGAKILHPSSIKPARDLNIPIILRNTLNPDASGTVISDYTVCKGLKAIAAKDGITTIKIKSGRMMQAYGFLRKIFEIFEKYETSVDMLTTSEISVAMTIDNNTFLGEIIAKLSQLGEIEVIKNQSIICIVGNYEKNRNVSIQNIVEGFETIPIRMISFGASRINISIVVDTDNKIEALNLLNNQIFKGQTCLVSN